MLHITNGDSAAGLILSGGIGGEILPWRDVLHEGPVPGGLELEAVSQVRSGFIADVGWGSESEVVASFERRDTGSGRWAARKKWSSGSRPISTISCS